MRIPAVAVAAALILVLVATGVVSGAFECSSCHDTQETNRTPRQLIVETPDHTFNLTHGAPGDEWCFGCHDLQDRDRLVLPEDGTVPISQSNSLCRECHGGAFEQWREGLHGIGGISEAFARNVTPADDCVDCHDPHQPGFEEPSCQVCHERMETNMKVRDLEVERPNHTFELNHGAAEKYGGADIWCFACHDVNDRNSLELVNGTLIEFNESKTLCSQCHAKVYKDWKAHVHGLWGGSWRNGTPLKTCVDCHDPHEPEFGKLGPENPPKQSFLSTPIPNYLVLTAIVAFVIVSLASYAAWAGRGGKDE